MYRIETVVFAKNRQLRQLLLPDIFGFPYSDAFAATFPHVWGGQGGGYKAEDFQDLVFLGVSPFRWGMT